MSYSIHENGRIADVYLYTELPRSNLASIFKSRKNLTKAHVQYLMYQLCCAVRHIHSAGIIHGAIQPSNILVDSDVSLRICDFSNAQTWNGNSLARGSNPSLCTTGGSIIYKAPELLLGVSKVSFAVDIWSIGCILAEFLNGAPLFDRNDLPGQIRTLLARLGKPSDDVLKRIASPQTVQNIQAIRKQNPPAIRELFPTANDAEMQLIHQTLLWDPMARSASTDLLDGLYFSQWRNTADEAVSHMAFRNDAYLETSQDAINQLIMSEVASFHKMVRQAGHEGSREDGSRSSATRPSNFHHGQAQAALEISYFDGSEEDGEFEWAPDE
ncbi:Mitogen-activated protein kinase spm1 Short=MAP kinase spm1; AltName: Full=MAP kinase pmk1 [Serendipita indica DSM 11827]|nr:Mitogen-activated protein kinase spm1 Short=MAP kinase spm1; AltName: Full=MAP kinase pmk1 [Serendipita indica DSM 11827]